MHIFCIKEPPGDVGPSSGTRHMHICVANYMDIHIKWDN